MDNKVDYAVVEGIQIRHERTVKRLIIALIIALLLVFASNALWLYAWCQYDYTSEETQSVVEQKADDGSNANYIGQSGEINNGGISKSNDND